VKPILLSDSSADIYHEYYAENDVAKVCLTYTINGQQFFDNSVAAETNHLYARMRKGDSVTTSQVNVQTFYDFFESVLPQGRPIVSLSMSSKLSGSFSASQTAREMILQKYPEAEIYTVDSVSTTAGQGQMLFYMVAMRDQGMSGKEIAVWLEENKTRFIHCVFVDDLIYLRRGGRLTAAESFFGNLLGIKPLIWMDSNGYLVPREKKRGRKQALFGLADLLAENIVEPEKQTVFIAHGDCPEEAEELKQQIMRRSPVRNYFIGMIGPVIGSHTGPGSLAVSFFGKDRKEVK